MIFTTQINATCGTYVLQSAREFQWNPFFDFFKKMSRYLMVTDSESYSGFPQINYRPLVMMDGYSKRCETNTVSLT